MTNEQLRLLIRAYADRLELEIDSARSQLPDDAERLSQINREYVGPLMFAGLFDNDPAHWKVTESPGEFVALLGLTSFLKDLRKADEDLAPQAEQKETP